MFGEGEMYTLAYGGHWKLRNVEAGSIFRLPGGNLALMTEYGDNKGFRHMYLLETGESCWADLDTEVIVLQLVDHEATEYFKSGDSEYVRHKSSEITFDEVPEVSQKFARGEYDPDDRATLP